MILTVMDGILLVCLIYMYVADYHLFFMAKIFHHNYGTAMYCTMSMIQYMSLTACMYIPGVASILFMWPYVIIYTIQPS